MFPQKENKKYHFKTHPDEKKSYLLMMFFITSFFSISPLHVRRRALQSTQHVRWTLKQLNQSGANPGPMQWRN